MAGDGVSQIVSKRLRGEPKLEAVGA
jgi:hypothetical protein